MPVLQLGNRFSMFRESTCLGTLSKPDVETRDVNSIRLRGVNDDEDY